MPYAAAALKAGVDGIAAAGNRVSFHTADPGTTGASEVTGGSYARQATTWETGNTGGTKAGSKVAAGGLPGGITIGWWGLWTAATGGTFLYGGRLTDAQGNAVSETYGAAGGTQEFTPTLVVTNPA